MQKRFHNYQLVSEIKRNTLSTTYLASTLQCPDRSVVVKLFAPSAFSLPPLQKQFLAEAATLLKQKHPSLVPLLDAGIVNNQAYLVGAYFPGGSLRDILDRQAPRRMPVERVTALLIELGKALTDLHTCQIVHGHIKPEHILFDAGGRVALTDISPGGEASRGLFERDHSTSTLRYLAPEQFSHLSSHLSDQYALCCVAYELYT